MKNAISEKALQVLDYLKEVGNANVTAADIAENLGWEKKSADGVITGGLVRNRNFVERVEAQIEVENAEGNKEIKNVKFIKLTDAGRNYDHDAALAADEAEKAAKDAE